MTDDTSNHKRLINVYAKVRSDGSKKMRCDPQTVEMPATTTDVKLVFKLEQTGTEDWAFPATKSSDDDFYGITISSDTDSEFHDASREASDKVSVKDRNNDNKTYSYTITLQNKLTGDTWHHDPSIENRSDG